MVCLDALGRVLRVTVSRIEPPHLMRTLVRSVAFSDVAESGRYGRHNFSSNREVLMVVVPLEHSLNPKFCKFTLVETPKLPFLIRRSV